MKRVLFVSSGNSKKGISPIISSQGSSLEGKGLKVDYFTIEEKGFKGYLGAIPKLRKVIKNKSFDLLHAHYGLSAIIAYVAKKGHPIVVSFMGDDIMGSKRTDGTIATFSRFLVWLNLMMCRFFYSKVIVKSNEMKEYLTPIKTEVIPNGVNIQVFHPEKRSIVRKALGVNKDEVIVLFVSNPTRPEKNFPLANKAVQRLEDENVRLHVLYDEPQETVWRWMNAANVLVLTSYHEGSPNVIKEAMACNCPIVSTDVGDVKNVIGDTEGCFIGGYEVRNFTKQLEYAIEFSRNFGKTSGREKIITLGLDSNTVALRIIEVYNKLLSTKTNSI